MMNRLLKYVFLVLAMIASTGLLWAQKKTFSNCFEKKTYHVSSADSTFSKSSIQVEKQEPANDNFHRELMIGLIGVFVGFILSVVYDEYKTCKRKKQYVKEIQLLTGAILKHTEVCNNAIEEYINNIKTTPHKARNLNQGILKSIERLTNIDATVVYDAFESKRKQEDFNTFLNLIDQLWTAYTYAYADYEKHNKETINDINTFAEIEDTIRNICNSSLVNPMMQNIILNYNKAHTNQEEIDIKLEYDTLISPIKSYLQTNMQIPINNLGDKVDNADNIYQSIRVHQLKFAAYMQQRLQYVNQTIDAIKKVML